MLQQAAYRRPAHVPSNGIKPLGCTSSLQLRGDWGPVDRPAKMSEVACVISGTPPNGVLQAAHLVPIQSRENFRLQLLLWHLQDTQDTQSLACRASEMAFLEPVDLGSFWCSTSLRIAYLASIAGITSLPDPVWTIDICHSIAACMPVVTVAARTHGE